MSESISAINPSVQGNSHKALKGINAEKYSEPSTLINRFFTTENMHPFDEVTWEKREVSITNDSGEIVFIEQDVEVPSFWSDTASRIVASKYFRGDRESNKREKSVKELISRVVNTITQWGESSGYFTKSEITEAFSAELSHILVNQNAAFNSPVWFNLGVNENPQCSACFILSVEDEMEALLELQTLEGRLFKYGSGTGTNLSNLRSSREKLSGGGTPSGPVSFMQAFDAWADVIKSGGKTRRAAKMQILNVDHPDILEFVNCKTIEEKKAWALIDEGYDGGFAVRNGAYDSVRFQNCNLSVRVSDEFMNAVESGEKFYTKNVLNGGNCEEVSAKKILELIAEGTHVCGDPGMQFDTMINDWHTCPNTGRINASNPCSEYMHLDNSACNLASINLLKYLDDEGQFDVEAFTHTVQVLLIAQDILIDNSSYPTNKIEKCAREYRQLGLGYTNLGALLMCMGVPYDSDAGREWAAAITALMTGQAYKSSSTLAKHLSPFKGYSKNRKPMLGVIRKHRDSLNEINFKHVPDYLEEGAKLVWNDAIEHGESYGFRNSQTTVLAPTGTISFMMDCDTTGIEPDIALIKYKKLVGGGFLKLVNHSVPKGLSVLGYTESQISDIISFINEFDSIEGAPHLSEDDLPVFDCAFKPVNGVRTIGHMGHLSMMAATQPFLSGAISKTVNLPNNVSVEEIYNVYLQAWKMGLKAVALYRDGSKRTQPLNTGNSKANVQESRPQRSRLPEERHAITHKFCVGGLEGYLTVGLFDDGTPGEIFIVVAKEGSTLSGVMDALATSVSIALQYGVPLKTLVKKFSHMRFEPSGLTQSKEIVFAKSIVDYIFRWVGLKFLPKTDLEELGLINASEGKNLTGEGSLEASADTLEKAGLPFQHFDDAPPCTSCGSGLMVRQGNCYMCLNCGTQGGCG